MPQPARLSPGLLGVLSFLAAVGPFATDMYLASFTTIADDLGTRPSAVQLTLTAFLLGMGAGQLVLGPLSDQFGRRPVLVAALAVFACAGIALVFSPNIGVFIALRLVQGFAGSAGVVISRAIAVDLSEGPAAIRAISLIAMFVGLGPLLAPPIGGAILLVADWRVVLAVVALLSVAMLSLAIAFVPESLAPAARSSAGPRSAIRGMGALLRDSRFVLLMIVFGLAFGSMMSYISASPFVGQTVLGMTPFEYSFAFAAGAAALILANSLNARLAGRTPAARMLLLGGALSFAAGLAFVALVATGRLTAWSFVACAFALTAGTGFAMSNASALALAIAPASRGSASALLGATQFAIGGAASPIVGAWGEHTALPMAVFVLTASALACAGALRFAQRRG